MAFEISGNIKTGQFSISIKKGIFYALGIPMILSGFATLANPWWYPLASFILSKSGINIQDNDSQTIIIGIIQIVIGISLLLYKHFIFDEKVKSIQLDKKSIQDIPIDKDKMNVFLSTLTNDHSYRSSMESWFSELCVKLNNENTFHRKKTTCLAKDFAAAGMELQNFIAGNFFVYPNNQKQADDFRYCMYPDLNIDRASRIPTGEEQRTYHNFSDKLQAYVSKCEDKFNLLLAHLSKEGIHI